MRARYIALLAAGLLSPLGCGGVVVDDNGAVADELTVPTAVANTPPAGVVQSANSLYWTTNHYTGPFPLRWTGRVYRAAKTSVPGQETVLYTETSGGLGSSFGNITFADYGGASYAYFLVSYAGQGTYLKRVPLDGSAPASFLGSGPSGASAGSPLFTDGTYLFFYGAGGLFAAPLDGSPTITIAPMSGITSLGGFDRAHVYFAAGDQVYWAYKPNFGHFTKLLTSTQSPTSPITTMYVTAGADNDDSATTFVAGNGYEVWQWLPARGLYALADFHYGHTGQVKSVSSAGSRVLWTWCDANNACSVSYKDPTMPGFDVFKSILVQTGARSIMGDASQIFFGDNYALERIAYWL